MTQQVRNVAPPRFLRESFHRQSRCFIRRVPLDVLVDRVLSRLSLKEILRLRKVDKAFFILTHEVTIWKHFFWQLDIPTPFFYENPARFTIDSREHECERMVARAIALEDNWHSTIPRAYNVNSFQYSFEILETKILPGGKYIVASAQYFPDIEPPLESDPRPKYAIIILELSGFPDLPRSKMVYCIDLAKRAYRIQARFMHYQSQEGIVISYVTRSFKPYFPGR
ncbi:hypothetical protein CPB85DRAFT_1234537 [Mucidula mucida]|nr:hypothetical protein CPB85DRAFT_1234537 [Mucidula mucida]